MPTITTTALSDFPALGFAAGGSEEEGGDVLFAALFGAVVAPQDVDNTVSSPEIPIPDLQQEGVDKSPLSSVLFSQIDKNIENSEDSVDVLSALISEPLLASDGQAKKDTSEENLLIEMPKGGEEKEEADAGVLNAIQVPVIEQTVQNERAPSKNQRPLTTQLITEIAEDLAPDYDVIGQKGIKQRAAGLIAGEQIKMQDDVPKIMAIHLDKMSTLTTTARQQQRATPDMSRAGINIADEIEGAVEDLSDGLALKVIRTASQTAPAVRSASLSGSGADINLATQTGSGAQTNLSTGSDARGQFAGASQAELRTSSAETWLELLDTQDENWTEQLVKRVERNLASAKEGIEFELNPRSLGKLRVTLSMQQNETQLLMRTETSQAAQLITDTQARLSAMLEDAGIKLTYLNTSSQNDGDGAQRGNSGNGRQNNQKDAQSNPSDMNTEQNNDATGASDSLVNIKA